MFIEVFCHLCDSYTECVGGTDIKHELWQEGENNREKESKKRKK